MIDLTKPIQTRDGREAKYLGELPDDEYPLVIAVCKNTGDWDVDQYSEVPSFIENDLSTLTEKNFVRVKS